MTRRLITVKVITITTAAVLLAGCGGKNAADSPGAAPASAASSAPADNGVKALTADEILERAKAALKAANAFRVKGSFVDEGERTMIDFKTRAGDLMGTMAMGKAKIELLAVAGTQYIRPNEEFWAMFGDRKKASTIAEVMGDRWAKLPDKDRDFANLFSAASIDDLLDPDGTVTKGETKDIAGVPAIGLVEGGTDGGTLYVATVGEAYPLRLEAADPSEGGLTFSDFRATFPEIKNPPAAEVIDLEKLQRN